MAHRIGIVLFDDAEELDFAGPWEVLTTAAGAAEDGSEVFTCAETADAVTAANGMRVLPDRTLEEAGDLDVVLVPGGVGTRREAENAVLVDWLVAQSAGCEWMTSVCSGSLVLHAAGLLEGRRATTYWALLDYLDSLGGVEVDREARWVRDGNVVTAAGVSAGIDMALWLAGELWSPDHSGRTRRLIQYDPEPPYPNRAPGW